MDIQEREHWDYEMGAASELQNAVALSRMELPADHSCQIADAVKAGKFLVIEEGTAYCPRTDAAIGSLRFIISTHLTYEDAERALHSIPDDQFPEDVSVYVFPYGPPMPTPVRVYDDSEIPF